MNIINYQTVENKYKNLYNVKLGINPDDNSQEIYSRDENIVRYVKNLAFWLYNLDKIEFKIKQCSSEYKKISYNIKKQYIEEQTSIFLHFTKQKFLYTYEEILKNAEILSLMHNITKNNLNIKTSIIDKIYNIILSNAVNMKIVNACIPLSIIFHESLKLHNIFNEIKEKFLLIYFKNDKFAVWHCVVECNNIIYDISSNTNILLNITYSEKCFISDSIPDGYIRKDNTSKELKKILKTNKNLINTYNRNPDNFWKNRNNNEDLKFMIIFRKKIFSLIKNIE